MTRLDDGVSREYHVGPRGGTRATSPSPAIDGQVRSIVREGLSVYRVDPDVLNRLAPTAIVTQTQCEVCAASLRDVEEAVCGRAWNPQEDDGGTAPTAAPAAQPARGRRPS